MSTDTTSNAAAIEREERRLTAKRDELAQQMRGYLESFLANPNDTDIGNLHIARYRYEETVKGLADPIYQRTLRP